MKKPDFSYRTLKYRRKKRKILYIGMALYFGVIMMGGFIYITQKQSDTSGTGVKKVLAVENNEVSQYPPIKIKKYVTINIVNGTGNTQQEGKMVKALVKSGYSLVNIELSKAEVFEGRSSMGTTITANADYEAIVANIKDALKPVIPEIADGIPNNDPNINSGFDVVIITGNRIIPTTHP